MKNKFKSGDIFYKIWKDEKDVYGERYVVKTILDNEVLVCIDRKNKEKFISPRDTNIILDKNQAIAKFNNLKQLQLQSSTIQAKPKTFHHTTKEKNPNFKKFNRFHKGETRYIVSNTPSGATITEYKIEKLIYDSLSVIVKDKNENQKKIYFDSLSTLLTKAEADIKLAEYKKLGPCKVAEHPTYLEAYCFKCGADIIRTEHNQCPVCKAHRCFNCGSCLCDYNTR